MTSNVEDQLDSSSIWNLLYFYCNQLYFTVLSNLSLTSKFNFTICNSLKEISSFEVLPFINYLVTLIPYDEFQLELLKLFCAIILTNTCLLIIVWKVYGKHICQRFMKPGKYNIGQVPFLYFKIGY